MEIEKKPISWFQRPEKNVRRHSQTQINEFIRSLEMFGQTRAIVTDENGTIIIGNGLYEALLAMGRDEADAYILKGLTESQKKKLMIADNRIYSLGSDNMDVFEELLAELDDFDLPGYDADLIATLVMTDEDYEEASADYGVISQADRESIQKSAETYAKEEAKYAETAEQIKPVAPPPPNAPKELQRRFLICPKCGEKIWL